MSRARDLSRLSNQTNFTPDVATGRVGLGSENPTAKLNVAGIVSATAFYGDGSNLEGVSGSGIGTALADEGVNSLVYYADKILGIVENTTIDVPDTSDSNVAYTKYAEVSVSDGIDLIIADGDDFIPDILGISSDVQVPGVLAGNGGRVRADNFSNKAGTGAPNFPSGLTGTTGSFTGNVSVGGLLTYEDVTNIDSVGLVTARTGLRVTDGGLIVTAGVSTLAADLSIADKIIHTGDTNTAIRFPAADTFTVETAGSERLRIDSSGEVGIGTVLPGNALHVFKNGDGQTPVKFETSNATGKLRFYNDSNGWSIDSEGELRFVGGRTGSGAPTRIQINADGTTLVGKTVKSIGTAGVTIGQNDVQSVVPGVLISTVNGEECMYLNRLSNDGTLISFRQDGSQEGTISVSGSTVSYNGAHLSRWSQLTGGAARTEILRGSVLSNLNEMCEWGEEDNEQLNRMQVSDVEGDKNVSGVFQSWDDDDDTYTNDFYCAMTGDFVIRIAQGTTVARGDLLMSAGDGTAKPQADDIVRSKTIAKVTSTTVSETYADGSYCIPCVLMAC